MLTGAFNPWGASSTEQEVSPGRRRPNLLPGCGSFDIPKKHHTTPIGDTCIFGIQLADRRSASRRSTSKPQRARPDLFDSWRSSSCRGFQVSCCVFTTRDIRRAYITQQFDWMLSMFDVYVRGKSQLLVVRRGAPLPVGLPAGWKKRRAARSVSEEIKSAVRWKGYYQRPQEPLSEAQSGGGPLRG